MYAAIRHVDKQSLPFSDVLKACFYEIANHANKNGAKGVSLIAANIVCKKVHMHSVFSSASSYADFRCAIIKVRHNSWQNQKKYTSPSPPTCLDVPRLSNRLAYTCIDLPTLAYTLIVNRCFARSTC
jgi:hypothetical protein